MKKLNVFVVWFVVLAVSVAQAEGLCGDLFIDKADVVNVTLAKNALYTPIYSTGQDILESFKFDEGPSPQKNMSIPPEAKDQYVFSSETAAIFKQKAAVTKRNPSRVIQYLEGHEKDVVNAAREQFDRMLVEFGKFYPEIYDVTAESITNKITGDKVTRKQVLATKDPYDSLELVGKLVQEDWLLMKKDPTTGEYILIGGYLAFPTHWSIERAIGWSLTQIHANIPGTPESRAKFVQMISMVLDRSLAAPDRVVVRNNWFVESDPRYALPDYIRTKSSQEQSIAEILASDKDLAEKKKLLKKLLCLRVERQTLRGLPGSGVVVFSINPHVFQISTILENPQVSQKVLNGLTLKYPEAKPEDMVGLLKDILSFEIQLENDSNKLKD